MTIYLTFNGRRRGMGMLSMYNIRKQKKKFFNNEFSQSLGYATILNNLKLSIMIP